MGVQQTTKATGSQPTEETGNQPTKAAGVQPTKDKQLTKVMGVQPTSIQKQWEPNNQQKQQEFNQQSLATFIGVINLDLAVVDSQSMMFQSCRPADESVRDKKNNNK